MSLFPKKYDGYIQASGLLVNWERSLNTGYYIRGSCIDLLMRWPDGLDLGMALVALALVQCINLIPWQLHFRYFLVNYSTNSLNSIIRWMKLFRQWTKFAIENNSKTFTSCAKTRSDYVTFEFAFHFALEFVEWLFRNIWLIYTTE